MSLKQPARYPVKHYSHLDAEAPQLANADGIIKTILKACLVTGYGAKDAAGWIGLFEDDYRIVLRRPLGTGNPPDIKVENGVINGVASHRIVSQDAPTGLDDANELAAVNMLARDRYKGSEWHLIVCDFGFLLCYHMGEDWNGARHRQHMMYVGSAKKTMDGSPDVFLASELGNVGKNGIGTAFMTGFLSNSTVLKDMRTNTKHTQKHFLNLEVDELAFNNDYLAQSIMVGQSAILPFYCTIPRKTQNYISSSVTIQSRPMLRYVNKYHDSGEAIQDKAYYIPLDYWEL